MNSRVLLVMFGLAIVLASSVQAQFTQSPNDFGAADSLLMDYSVIPDATTNKLKLRVDLYGFNDANNLASIGVGFVWDNANLRMDSAVMTPVARTSFNYVRYLYMKDDIDTTNYYHLFQFGGSRITGQGLVATPTRKMLATYYFTLSAWTVDDSFDIDTTRFSGGTILTFVDVTNKLYKPYWAKPGVFHDTAYHGPSNIILSEDTLFFNSIVGQAAPAAQTFQITSDNEPLTFTLIESAGWLLKSPSSGATPRTVTVSISTAGLSVGTYFDSIQVQAAAASNNPQYEYVKFTLAPPPPTIAVSPSLFTFTAASATGNPPTQTLTITNSGGSSLNWSVTNGESWLTLAPTSGTAPSDVTLSVDITGLAYGTYYDTVVVSDPIATNTPVSVPVKLTVSSDLPVIDVDTAFHWVVGLAEMPVFSRNIEVRNSGGGVLNFWIVKKFDPQPSLPDITGFEPDSGTAPGVVSVQFLGATMSVPLEKTDTVLVYSNEAVNSPVEVAVHLRVVDQPSVIAVSANPLSIDVFECGQGLGQPMPSVTFTVSNIGGDNPMAFTLNHESTLWSLNANSGTAPKTFTLTAVVDDIPVGTYVDTIFVTSTWALNSPVPLVVRYNVIPAAQPAGIYVSRTEFLWPYREGDPVINDTGFSIHNRYGGCMPWYIQEEIEWLTPSATDGVIGDLVGLTVNPEGMAIGDYQDTLLVLAPGAANSPVKQAMHLQVWRLVGDWDWNGLITLDDMTLMISYLYIEVGDYPPQPIFEVGNCDCGGDGMITMSDLTAMIDYLYISLAPMCGNPY